MNGDTIHKDINNIALAMNNVTNHCREENKEGILDSGCSHHYLLLAAPCRNRRETRKPVRVTIPNGKTIESTYEGELKMEALPEAARHVHIYLAWLTTVLCLSGNFAMQDAKFCSESTKYSRTMQRRKKEKNEII